METTACCWNRSRSNWKLLARPIAINIDGVSAALFSDLDLDPRLARPILMTPRTLFLATHFIEEQDQGDKWRHVPGNQVTYTGAQAQASPNQARNAMSGYARHSLSDTGRRTNR